MTKNLQQKLSGNCLTTQVVNIKKGDLYDVYIGRPSEFGNPFEARDYGLIKCLKYYEAHIRNRLLIDPEFKDRLLELKGLRLGCFCKPNMCHGDILVKIIEELS